MKHRLLVVSGLSWLLCVGAPSLSAQDEPSVAREAPAPAIAAASKGFACVNARGDEIVAAGRDWRASFTPDGVEFLPALGRRAPRAMPLRLELESIRRSETVVIGTPRPVVPTVGDMSVTFPRGAVSERYEARPEGLEQSFVFGERLGGEGDLVVRLRIVTDLPAAESADGTLQWLAPGVGGVRMGAVTGIDATGWRADGSLKRSGATVELVLPGDFVDRASYPMVLDPLISTSVEALPGADCDFPDVAYDPFTDTYCVVWTQFFGGGTSSVVGSVFLAANLGYAYAFVINQSGDEDMIRVTTIGGWGVFTLVWRNHVNGAITITGLVLDPSTGSASNLFGVAGPGGVDTFALSGEATPVDDDCMVVWDDDTYGILGRTITVDQNLGITLGPVILIGGGPTATEPTFSKQGGNPGLHVVAWVDRPAGLPGWVRAQVVDHDMNLQGPGVWIQNVPENAGHPAIDGDGFLFLVAWEEQEPRNPAATDIRGRTITVSPAGITSQGPVLDLAAYPSDLDTAPDLAMLGDKFGLVYQSGLAGTQYTDNVYFRALARNGTPIGDELLVDLNPTGSYLYEHAPRIIGRRDGDFSTPAVDGLLVFADQDNVNIDSDVALQAVASMGAGGPVLDLGGGCGPGGLATANGAFALGNVDFRFELHGAAPLAIPFLCIGLGTPPRTCGACILTDPLTCDFVPNVAGTAVKLLPLPGDAALLGIVVEFQWATLNVAYVGCPMAPGLAASNRVQAQLDY